MSRMNMCDASDRYLRDTQFKNVVDMMVSYAMSLEMSPGELREAAVFAEIKFQAMQPISNLFPNRGRELNTAMMEEDRRRRSD